MLPGVRKDHFADKEDENDDESQNDDVGEDDLQLIHSGFLLICERLFIKLNVEVKKVFWRLKYWFSTRIQGCIFPVL